MYAIIELAGKQHRVSKDQVFVSERTGVEPGKDLTCEQILAVGEGSDLKVGQPFVSGATVKLKVLEDIRGPKIKGFKYKPKTTFRKSWGHRQDLQKIQVVEIKN